MDLRETNFKNDVKVYGPIGEKDLFEILKKSPKTVMVENIADDLRFKDYDIDIIQYKKPGIDREKVLYDLQNNIPHSTDDYVLYEVKSDTYGHVTRNIDYEYNDCGSNKIGCAARSKCDYFYYVFLNEENEIAERFLMRMHSLREKINELKEKGKNNKFNKVYNAKFETIFREHHMIKKSGDETLNYLINIDYLKTEKIATKIA